MKNLQIAELFEVYKNLFTEKQKQILTEYYVYDLSLGEIAENNNVSRQAVNDTIKKCQKQLTDYENKVGYYKLTQKINNVAQILEQQGNKTIAQMLAKIIGE